LGWVEYIFLDLRWVGLGSVTRLMGWVWLGHRKWTHGLLWFALSENSLVITMFMINCRCSWLLHARVFHGPLRARQRGADAERRLREDETWTVYPRRLQRRLFDRRRRLLRRPLYRAPVLPRRSPQSHRYSPVPARLHLLPGGVLSMHSRLVACHRGRTSVFDRRTFPVLRSTYSKRVTTYVGKPSAVG